jgi:hypothetical protein
MPILNNKCYQNKIFVYFSIKMLEEQGQQPQRLMMKPISYRSDIYDEMSRNGQYKTNISTLLAKAMEEACYDDLEINEIISIHELTGEIIKFRDLFFDHKDKFIERLQREKNKLKEQMFLDLQAEKKKMINDIRSQIAAKVVESKKKKVTFDEEESESEEVKPVIKKKPVAKKK